MGQNNTFRFKQFEIKQEKTPMKVGTDGVLLGAWANVENDNQILDIGTGTGLVALMTAQRNPTATIDAIEIDPNAAEEAKKNIKASKFSHRIDIINQSLQEFAHKE